LIKKLAIGIIGTRGIPNQYGGYEAAVQELAPRLTAKGHQVVVYCSPHQSYQKNEWNGVKLNFQYNPEDKIGTAGQFIYDLKCNMDARKRQYDVIIHMGYTSDSVWYWLWNKKSKHITNMDGMEWRRSKYTPKVQAFLKKAEKWAALHSDLLIADSEGVMQYLQEKYPTPIHYIAYGAEIPQQFDDALLKPYHLVPNEYDLLIARMEPENNLEMAIEAKIKSESKIPLVIFGNQNAYGQYLIEHYKNERIIRFYPANYQSEVVNALRYFSRFYIHGHSVGGTNPSLLEAMAAQCHILAHGNVFNKGVLKDGGAYFTSVDQLSNLFTHKKATLFNESQIEKNIQRIKNNYHWDLICEKYEAAFYQICT
jgi:glycosyltransferase involved in cell wall biosynthesis